jgi:VCBS repeat-containing protein
VFRGFDFVTSHSVMISSRTSRCFMKRKDLMLKLIAVVITLVLVWNLNPIPVQAISVHEIAVEPEVATNQVGTNHTVTAVATAVGGEAVPGLPVHFSVIRGPNLGVVGDNITDVNGEASFTYTSNGFPGIDTISVEIDDPNQPLKEFAEKVWLEPASGQIETDVFLQSAAYISGSVPPIGDFGQVLTGITVIEVDLGSLGDSDGDGLEEVSAKIIMMELTNPSGSLVLTGGGNSVGKIEELTNNTPGVLDIPPFAASGTAVSTFEFDFWLLFIEEFYFGNIEPVSLVAVIDHKPPEAGTWYSETNPVIHIGGEDLPGPYDMYWDWFVLGEYSPLPEVQLELLPESATNPTGTNHTVTAVYTLDGFPLQGKYIRIIVDSGPNAVIIHDSFTDAEGKATLTYTGDGGAGTDKIIAATWLTLEQDIHAHKVWQTPPPPNQPPVANDDAYSTDEDTTLLVVAPGVLGNDSDADGDPLTAALDTGPGNGTLTLNADGSFTYTPDSDFNGIDSFIYHANDGSADSNNATVTITVDAVNDPPVANDDAATTDEDTAVTIDFADVLVNDVDVDGDALIVSSVTSPANGTLIDNGDDTVTYTPDANFNGDDSFTYTANDGQANSNVATVTINVIPVNDPPVATDDAYATDEDTTLNIAAPGMLGNDSDPDGDPLTVVVVTVPQHGSGSISSDGSLNYMPDANFSGSDTFSYKASDGTAESNISTVTITVNPINDPPVAVDDSVSVDEGGHIMVDVLSNDTDPDSTLSYANVTVLAGPSNGMAVVSSVGINYTHDGSETTSDTFIYQVEDGAGGSDNATVTVDINPVNDPPVADPNGPYSGTVGVPVTFYGSNSSDCDGTIVSYDWDFGDGAVGPGVAPAHSYAAAGIYTVTLTVIDNDGASHTATTSVDIASIAPEEMIENLVDEIDGMDLPGGIKNSLTASLYTAIKVLGDSNPKNDVAAVNILKAFIKKVEAQCDKKIPEEVADDLITKAQDIIMVLSLGT